MPQVRLSDGPCTSDRDLVEELLTRRQPFPTKIDKSGTELNALQPLTVEVETTEQVLTPAERPHAQLHTSRAAIGLNLASLLLPHGARRDWLEEQHRYLADLDTRRERLAWVFGQLVGMPRYAYTVRTAPGTFKSTFAPLDIGGELIEAMRAELATLRTRRRRAAFLAGITLALSRIDFARRSKGRGWRIYLVGLMRCLPRLLLVLRAIRLVRGRPL